MSIESCAARSAAPSFRTRDRVARPHITTYIIPSPILVRLPRAAGIAVALLAGVASPGASSAQTTRRDSTRADTAQSLQSLERVTVTAIRASDRAPIAQKTISRAEIERRQYGQDVPLLLQGLSPSLTTHTETGTTSGYSYVRLRGIDQSRINITIDGIPLNDMEDQVLYFANLGDLLSGVNSVQVQRGVGTSSAGTAAFGGSVNFETTPAAARDAGADVQLQGGSFDSRRLSATFRSGLTDSRFAVTGRLSAQQTNGYRYNAGVAQRSAFVSGGWFGDRNILKFTALAGLLRDTLAYYGATREELAANRRVNPLTSEDRDRFGQQLFALQYSRALSTAGDASWSTTVYRNSAGGSYDYYDAPDVYVSGLDHAWYGVTSTLHRETASVSVDAGINANTYERRHRSWLGRDQGVLYYDNTGHKQDASVFGKLSYVAGRARLFGDLQVRHARFRYEPDANAGLNGVALETTWTFVNPKAGVTFELAPRVSAFASFGRTTREPARNDILAGADNIDSGTVSDVRDFQRVRPESVNDAELGVTWRTGRGELSANVYAMEFENNILPFGIPSASGSPLRRNVGRSYRRGIEADGTWRPSRYVELGANATVSMNRIIGYTDATGAAPARYANIDPLLSPGFISAQRVNVTPSALLSFGVEGRYQSTAQLDNTGNPALTLPDFYLVDALARIGTARYALTVRATNIGDSQRYYSGYADDGVAYYFPLPPRAVYVTAEIRF